MSGIYFHIPFCKKACHYCNFHFSTTTKLKDEVIKSLSKELKKRKNEYNSEISSIYFGGGTPSILSSEEINTLIKQCKEHYSVSREVEITLEANPEDLTSNKLDELLVAEINRLSIGVQSFQNAALKWMNRSHDSHRATKCIQDAQNKGFNNISLDLIYGLPEHLKRDWKADIKKAIALKVSHISAYNLTVEHKTALAKWVKEKRCKMPSQESCKQDYDLLLKLLKEANYEQYEISNFSIKGFRSRHNSSYWKTSPYLGIGPSAHSYDGKRIRKWNISNNSLYVKRIRENKIAYKEEYLSDVDIANEEIILGTRSMFGVSINKVISCLSIEQQNVFHKQLKKLIEFKQVQIKEDRIYVNSESKFLTDYIARELFILST